MKVGDVALSIECHSRCQGFPLSGGQMQHDLCSYTGIWSDNIYIDSKAHTPCFLLIPHSSHCRAGYVYSEMTIALISDERCFWQIQQYMCDYFCKYSNIYLLILFPKTLTLNFFNFCNHYFLTKQYNIWGSHHYSIS